MTNRKIRVLIVTADLSTGGGQKVVYELAKNIRSDEFEIAVLCYAGHADTLEDKNAASLFHVIYLNESGKTTIRKIWHIFQAINRFNPDIVHAHLGGVFYSVLWAILYRKKVVITVHAKPDKAFSQRIVPGILYLLKKNRTWMIGVSKENEIALQKHFNIYDDRIDYVNNGIDLSCFYKKNHTSFTFINVARQDSNKNQSGIIRCFGRIHKENPNTTLLLAGDGPTNADLRKLAVATVNDGSIKLTGMVSNVEDYYAISDVYIQFSHREAMPMAMLEAMAAGLPLIGTNVGGLCDIIKDNGYLVPDNDEESLYEAMKKIMQISPADYNKMSEASKNEVKRFSAEEMARKYCCIYQKILP